MDHFTTNEIAANRIANGRGRILTVSPPHESPEEIVEQLKEVRAKAVIFTEITNENLFNNALQAARLYRVRTGENLMAVYCKDKS